MKRIRIHTIFIMLTLCLCIGNQQAHAQRWKQIQADEEHYLTGEGWGNSDSIADAKALADLVSKISSEVESTFSIIETEDVIDGDLDASTYIKSKIKTYSNATLHNTERIVIDKEPKAHVLRYIKRSDINRIFEGRRRKVQEYLNLADNAEKNLKIGDALRCYYFAFTLLKTLQFPDTVSYSDSNNCKHIVSVWVPEQMKNIVDNISVEQSNRDGEHIELWFTYKGKPVVDLWFDYYSGGHWNTYNPVKDGRGEAILQDDSLPYLTVKVNYAFSGFMSNINPEVQEVIKVIKDRPLFSATKKITLASVASHATVHTPKNANPVDSIIGPYKAIVEMKNDTPYRKIVDEVIAAIKSGNYNAANHCFTTEGLDMYGRLLDYGTARIYGQPNYKIYDKGDAVVARSVAMSFSFKKGAKRTLVEDVVFTFDKSSRKIDCLAFALDKKAADDILSQGYWPESARMTLLEFMENYKTAYCFKRSEYLESIFDNDAYIIVGHVVNRLKRGDNNDFNDYANHHLVTYTQYSTKQYIKHLIKCFNANECVNIHFSNNEVIKSGKGGEIYGIQIKQDYYSTTYGDSGYLLLIVDLNNPDTPIIKMRTWQEEPDPKEGLYTIFKFDF